VSEPIQHHYVPAVYLRSFAGADGCVWVHDFEQRKSFPGAPSGVARKRDYNSLTNLGGELDRVTMESFFGQSETKLPRLLEAASNSILDFDQQTDLIKFVALQMVRAPMTRDQLSYLANMAFPRDAASLVSLGVDAQGVSLLQKAWDGDRRAADEVSLRLSKAFLPARTMQLERLNYSLIHLRSADGLLSTDNPAILVGVSETGAGWRLVESLPGQRIIMIYPLTQSILLFGVSKNRRPGELFSFGHFEIHKADAISRMVNSLLVSFARRQVYAPNRERLIEYTDVTANDPRRTDLSVLGARFRDLVRKLNSQASIFREG
jgi:hypothetical protein